MLSCMVKGGSSRCAEQKHISDKFDTVVIGAGSVAIELGIAYRRWGARITMLERKDRLMPALDVDIVDVLRRSLENNGIALHMNATLLKITRNNQTYAQYIEKLPR